MTFTSIWPYWPNWDLAMASMKATWHIREMHESVAKDLGYSSFKKVVYNIVVLGDDILPHYQLGMVKDFVMPAYPASLVRL